MSDDHRPRPGQYCADCQELTDHFKCWDTTLDLSDVNPAVELHDASMRVVGEAA